MVSASAPAAREATVVLLAVDLAAVLVLGSAARGELCLVLDFVLLGIVGLYPTTLGVLVNFVPVRHHFSPYAVID